MTRSPQSLIKYLGGVYRSIQGGALPLSGAWEGLPLHLTNNLCAVPKSNQMSGSLSMCKRRKRRQGRRTEH
jgi:hypothetical protein